LKSNNNIRISSFEKLISPNELQKKIPETEKSNEVIYNSRNAFIDILNDKDKRFVVIIGPCSIHNIDLAMDYAKRLKKLDEQYSDKLMIIMRVYFEKPRTAVGWKGLINDPYLNGSNDIAKGLELARKLLIDIADMDLACATELLDPTIAAFIGDLVTWSAIGARTTESQTHRQMASGLSSPIGFKNGTDGNLDVAINAMLSSQASHSFLGIDENSNTSILHTTGNPYSHLVLRGGAGKPNYDSKTISIVEEKLKAENFAPKIMIDCSHENSGKNHRNQSLVLEDILKQRKAGNRSIFGCMIESNIHSGNQIVPEKLEDLKYGVSITDKCIDWEETEDLIANLYKNINT
jgi:3-deoxy-7-phosphoheptulonate synthase